MNNTMYDEEMQYRQDEKVERLPLLVIVWLLLDAMLIGGLLYGLATVPGIWR